MNVVFKQYLFFLNTFNPINYKLINKIKYKLNQYLIIF